MLRALAKSGQLQCRRGENPNFPRYWYHGPGMTGLRKAFAAATGKRRRLDTSEFELITEQQAAVFLDCSLSIINRLIEAGRLPQLSTGGIFTNDLNRLARILEKLGREGKLDARVVKKRRGGNKLWFPKSEIVRLPDPQTLSTRRSALVARANITAGEQFVTQAEAAEMARVSISCIRYQRKKRKRKLWSKRLGPTTIVLKLSQVRQLAKKKNRANRKKLLGPLLEASSTEEIVQTVISSGLWSN